MCAYFWLGSACCLPLLAGEGDVKVQATLASCIHMDTIDGMPYVVQQTAEFRAWHKDLGDLKARIAIARRLDRAAAGNLGDAKSVGEGVSEMRIDVGAGYRVYFAVRGNTIIVLLCGGNKKTQQRDIKHAAELAKEV